VRKIVFYVHKVTFKNTIRMNLRPIYIGGFLINNLFEIFNEIHEKNIHFIHFRKKKQPVSTNSKLQKACSSSAIEKTKI